MGIRIRLVTLALVATLILPATISFMKYHSAIEDKFLVPSTEFSRSLHITSSPSLFPRSLDEATYNPSTDHLHERQIVEEHGWSKLQLKVFIAWMTAICLFAVWAVFYVCFSDLIMKKWREWRGKPASEEIPV